MKRICIYCGSSSGARPEYISEAEKLGHLLAEKKIDLIYGGANVGLMGALANAVLEGGGNVTGVMPRFLVEKEVAHSGLTELKVVDSMHERKMQMAELADGFIALPGGLGTMEEFFEILTWTQLGLHQKPCGLLNVNTYYDSLIRFLDHIFEERFLSKTHYSMVLVENSAEALLQRFATYQAPVIKKWIDREGT